MNGTIIGLFGLYYLGFFYFYSQIIKLDSLSIYFLGLLPIGLFFGIIIILYLISWNEDRKIDKIALHQAYMNSIKLEQQRKYQELLQPPKTVSEILEITETQSEKIKTEQSFYDLYPEISSMDSRNKVKFFVEKNPSGSTFTQIMRGCKLSKGVAATHIKKNIRDGFIFKKDKLIYPNVDDLYKYISNKEDEFSDEASDV